MNQRSARVIDLDEVRRKRADEQRRKAEPEASPVMLVWVPVWFWVPVWPAM